MKIARKKLLSPYETHGVVDPKEQAAGVVMVQTSN